MIEYNLMIVGGGICGLYNAYKFLKKNPDKHACIVEKDSQCGGRARQIYFENVLVPTGAGIGRYLKDKKLYALIEELGLSTHVFTTIPAYYNTPNIAAKTLKTLREAYKNQDGNFKDYAISVLGNELYQNFVLSTGYTDFEHLDAYDALYHYGFEDTYGKRKRFTVPWNAIIDKLEQQPGLTIYTNNTIKTIHDNTAKLSSGESFVFADYIVTVPPQQLNKSLYQLMPSSMLIKSIRAQPFAYVYAKTRDPEFARLFTSYTIVPPPMQKIIPLAENVYIIAYADNASAEKLKRIKSIEQLEKLVYACLRLTVKIDSFQVIYRKTGTHYRTDSKAYMKNAHIRGEAYALNQGWTEGGL